MFNPSREEVREMFFAAWRKYRAGVPLAGIEALALDVILLHPEYHEVLDASRALSRPRLRRRVESFSAHEPARGAGGAARSTSRPASAPLGISLLEPLRRAARSAAPGAGMPRRDGVARAAHARHPMPRRTWSALPRAHYAGSTNDAHKDYGERPPTAIVTRPSWLHKPWRWRHERTLVPAGPFSRRMRPGYRLGRAGARLMRMMTRSSWSPSASCRTSSTARPSCSRGRSAPSATSASS